MAGQRRTITAGCCVGVRPNTLADIKWYASCSITDTNDNASLICAYDNRNRLSLYTCISQSCTATVLQKLTHDVVQEGRYVRKSWNLTVAFNCRMRLNMNERPRSSDLLTYYLHLSRSLP